MLDVGRRKGVVDTRQAQLIDTIRQRTMNRTET